MKGAIIKTDGKTNGTTRRETALRAFRQNRLLLLLAAVLLLSGFTGDAEELAQETGADAALAASAELSDSLFTEEEKRGDAAIDVADKLGKLLKSGGESAVSDAAASFALLLGVLVLASLLHALGALTPSEGLASMCDFVTLLSVSGVAYSLFRGLFRMAGEALNGLTAYMASLLPVSGALLTAGGSVTGAAGGAAAFSLFLSCVSLLSSAVLFPFLQVSFALCFAGAIPGAADLSPLSGLVRNTSAVLLAFLYTSLGFLIGLQHVVSAQADNYLYRTVKFASGVFIPVVGGILGEAARTVAGGLGVIRSTVGTVGVIVTLALLLPPLLTVAVYRFLLSLCAALAKMLGCAREGRLLSELGGTVGLLFGVLAGAEAVTILYLACFIKTGLG